MPGPPIRTPSDHSPPAGSPRLIAGHHVLHRPLMPRHPPNAQKNKQQNTRQNQETCRRNLTVRCSRPLYSSQPTHPHPPKNPHNQEPQTGQATRAHCPRTPTACHPHTRTPARTRGTHHNRPPRPQQPQQPTTSRRVSYTTQHHNQPTPHTQRKANQPQLPCETPPPGRPRPHWPRQNKQPKKREEANRPTQTYP